MFLYTKKLSNGEVRQLFVQHYNLFRNCAAWANVRTCTAFYADVRINAVMIAFGNSSHRALIFTGATGDTIFRNFISHNRVRHQVHKG